MSDDEMRTAGLLEAVAERAPAGPAPVELLHRRRRRDRAVRAAAVAAAVGLLAAGAVTGASWTGAGETGPERLVTAPDRPPAPPPVPPVRPSLDDLRPAGPDPALVTEAGPVAEVYLDAIGGARTDPLDPSLLVLAVPAGQAGSGPQDAGSRCWSGATARATADGDVVRLDPRLLVNARPPVQPSLPPGSEYVCNLSLGSTQVLVQLPGPLDGRPLVLPGGRRLDVADGRLLPVAGAVPRGWVFRSAGATAVRYESAADRAVAADLHAGVQPEPDAFPVVDRFEVAPGQQAVVTGYGPLGVRVGWADAAGPLWADVAGLPLPEVRALVRSVVRAGDALS